MFPPRHGRKTDLKNRCCSCSTENPGASGKNIHLIQKRQKKIRLGELSSLLRSLHVTLYKEIAVLRWPDSLTGYELDLWLKKVSAYVINQRSLGSSRKQYRVNKHSSMLAWGIFFFFFKLLLIYFPCLLASYNSRICSYSMRFAFSYDVLLLVDFRQAL